MLFSQMTSRRKWSLLARPRQITPAVTRPPTGNQTATQQSHRLRRTTFSLYRTTETPVRTVTAPRARRSPAAAETPTAPMTWTPASSRAVPQEPTAAQNLQRSSLMSQQRKKMKKTSRRRLALPARQPMSIRLRGGRVTSGGSVCSASRRSTPTGRPRGGWEREEAPCPSAVSVNAQTQPL